MDLAQPGDSTAIRGGRYTPTRNIQILHGGTASLPITITGDQSERVIIDGEQLPNTPAPLGASIPNSERGAIHLEASFWNFVNLEIINGPYAIFGRNSSNNTYWSDIQDGTHCAVRPEWRTPLQQNIQKFLLKTGNAAGTFRISSRKAGNLAEWRDWQTPTLSDGPPTSTTTTTSNPPPPPPGGCTVRDDMNAWNATYTPTSGQVTAPNVGFNAVINANGGSISGFGFQTNHTGNTAKPTSFTLNGMACSVP